MLAGINRFHGHKSLGFVYRNGQAVRDRLLTMKFIANNRRRQPRVSVVVSKKITKSAVKRNRIRRRIYEAVRVRLNEFTGAYDISIIVSSLEVVDMSHLELTNLINNLLSRADIIGKR